MFQFRLKSILNYRQHLYKNAQVSLAVAQQEYKRLQEEQKELVAEIERQDRTWKEKQAGGIRAAENSFFRDYLHTLEKNLAVVEKQLNEASNEVRKAREALLERKKEVQILDSLEQEAKQDYRIDQLKKEQQQLDELAVFADYHKNPNN